MSDGILVINGGSTSVKFAGYLYDGGEHLSIDCRGQVQGIGSHPSFVAKAADGKPIDAHEWEADHPLSQDGALRFIFEWLMKHRGEVRVIGVGHRVVLGGMKYEKPVLVTDQVLADLDALCAFEPSHQPYEIAVIRALLKARPSLPQVACFDTSFHRTMPRVAQIYALPRKYSEGNSAPLGLSRHLLRLHQPAASEVRRRRPGESLSPISAAAAACAQCSTARASRPRWGSARSRACRCLPASGKSMPAFCYT